jgi:threonine/homoserine/homoserine lactone efflux protein
VTGRCECEKRQNPAVHASLFGAYLVTVMVLILLPGPDMLFALATGIKGGPRAGFFAAVGAAAGEVVHITTAALGLAALFRAVPPLFDLVRFAGAAYLVYLGVQTLRRRDDAAIADVGRAAAGVRRAFWRGALTNLLNPKMALFTIAFLPQFVDTSRDVALQFLVLGACFIALEILVDGTVGILAGRFRQLLARRRAAKSLHLASGTIFVGLGARVALDR